MPEAYINGKRVEPASLGQLLWKSPVGTVFEAVISKSNRISVKGEKLSQSTYEYVYNQGRHRSLTEKGDAKELQGFIENAVNAYLQKLRGLKPVQKEPKTGLPPRHPMPSDVSVEQGIAINGTRRKVFGRGKRKKKLTRRRK